MIKADWSFASALAFDREAVSNDVTSGGDEPGHSAAFKASALA